MRTHFAAPVEHFIEETIVIIFSQHQSKSSVLSNLINSELIKTASDGERKFKKRSCKGPLGTPRTLIKRNEQSRFRDSVHVCPQPPAGETMTHRHPYSNPLAERVRD
jgi:hypothetical protein